MPYQSDNFRSCLGILVLTVLFIQIIIFVLSYVVATPIIIFDYLVQPFTGLGITNPVAAWMILGSVIGSVIGLVQGLKRSGRSYDIGKVYVVAFGFLLILAIGSYFKVSSRFDTSTIQKVVLKENFSSSNKWDLMDGATVKDGGLFHLQPKKNKIGWSIWNGQSLTDLDFLSDVAKVSGPNDVPFGLLARVTGDKIKFYYYLWIKGNGEFAMGKHTEYGIDDLNLIRWTKSSSIKSGNNKNRLRIVCKGDLIIGFINNERVGNFVAANYPAGKVALTSVRGNQDGVAVYFSNVIVKENSK